MNYQVNGKFSTKDQDNDDWDKGSCAKKHKSGWWYYHRHFDGCCKCNLNGPYIKVS